MDPGEAARAAASRQSTPTPSLSAEATGDRESAHQLTMEGHVADAQRQLLDMFERTLNGGGQVGYLREELAWPPEPFRRTVGSWQRRSTMLASPTAMRLRRALRALPLPARLMATLKRFVLQHAFGTAPRTIAHGAVASAGRRRAGDSRTAAPALPPLAPPQLPDVFIWGITDWRSRVERPQHLARELAGAGHRVFYISPQFADRTGPGFEVEPLDDGHRLFAVRLHAQAAPSVNAKAARAVHAQILAGVGRVLEWAGGSRTVNLVQHPFWLPFAEVMPNQWLVYDWISCNVGFRNDSPDIVALEHRLLRNADLVVVTSSWLERVARQISPCVVLVRDAGDYAHFSGAPRQIYRDSNGRRIIGYCGVISEWFDTDLVRLVAASFPDALVLLIGDDTIDARHQLATVANVTFAGEVPYADLPGYLHAFDVCIVPWQIARLTLAASVVGVYDYLSTGKPVVTVDLPEMRQFGEQVRRTGSAESFVSAVRECLAEPVGGPLADARKRFASEHTWAARADVLRHQIDAIQSPLISVIVATYNNLELTRQCLASLDLLTKYPNCEVIVVDNASSDGTQVFLEQWTNGRSDRRVILNQDNRGFAAACNQGMEAAGGEYLVLLNNDTVVTAGWLGTLIGHLRHDPRIGLIGAVTNNIDNEARIDIGYADLADMHAEARLWTTGHLGQTRPMPSVAFFCVAMSREVHREVGPLDEAYGVGMFEDDDYCRRVEQTGRRIVCALDVFIHHHSAASFDAMDQARRWELFEHNKQIYEAKWGRWPRR